jgi:hypothetical protein
MKERKIDFKFDTLVFNTAGNWINFNAHFAYVFRFVIVTNRIKTKKLNSVTLVCKRTIPTDRPSDRRFSANSVPNLQKGCCVVSVADPYDRSLGFLDRTTCITVTLMRFNCWNV